LVSAKTRSFDSPFVHSKKETYTERRFEKLEKVQKKATKFILKTEDCYADRLKILNLYANQNQEQLAVKFQSVFQLSVKNASFLNAQ